MLYDWYLLFLIFSKTKKRGFVSDTPTITETFNRDFVCVGIFVRKNSKICINSDTISDAFRHRFTHEKEILQKYDFLLFFFFKLPAFFSKITFYLFHRFIKECQHSLVKN